MEDDTVESLINCPGATQLFTLVVDGIIGGVVGGGGIVVVGGVGCCCRVDFHYVLTLKVQLP